MCIKQLLAYPAAKNVKKQQKKSWSTIWETRVVFLFKIFLCKDDFLLLSRTDNKVSTCGFSWRTQLWVNGLGRTSNAASDFAGRRTRVIFLHSPSDGWWQRGRLTGRSGCMLSRAGKRITCTGRLRKKQSQTPLDTTINTITQSDGVEIMTLIIYSAGQNVFNTISEVLHK